MKSVKIIFLTTALFVFSGCETLNQAGQILTESGLGNPSTAEISSGLKQALEFGMSAGSDRLSATDGFFSNAAIKILFPEEALKVERTLRSVGLNNLADNVILSLNRAAEAAAIEAKPIFISAIKGMTFSDASNILLSGQQDAATIYFRRVTNEQLNQKFNPIIQSSLNKVGATRYWTDAITAYNNIPFVSKVNPNLSGYVTQKAIDGIFHEIAQEELKIRNRISARSTPLLQKVFAYADRNKG
jgi:hypothetical protein